MASGLVARRRLVMGALAIGASRLLSGCALSPTLPSSASSREFAGRFSVSWTDTRGPEGTQRSAGRFLLRVDGVQSEVEVSSPLGQTLAIVRLGPGSASLVTADGRRYTADRPETLTEQAFGWPAPLAQLPGWLQAPAGRGSADASTDQPVQFTEANWQVTIEAWQTGSAQGSPRGTPRRLLLRWPAGAAPVAGAQPPGVSQVELRLIVDDAAQDNPR